LRYLLDTCVISELQKATPNAQVIAWLDARDEESLFLSVLTLGEIQKGIANLNDPARKDILQRWLDGELRRRFSERIVAIDEDIALTWGQIQGDAQRRGMSIPVIDGLIGATAVANNLTVVTRNVDDIGRTGARILNPWNTSEGI